MKADPVVWKPLNNLLKPRGNPRGYSWLLAAQSWTSWTLACPSAAVPRYATACFHRAGLYKVDFFKVYTALCTKNKMNLNKIENICAVH